MNISVCIPTWNPYRSLERFTWLIDAIKSAEYADEVILLIEGSYRREDLIRHRPDIKIIEYRNPDKSRLNVGHIFNELVKFASCEYISFCGDDDKYAPDNLRVLKNVHGNPDVLYFPYYVIRPEDDPPNNFGIFQAPASFTIPMLLQCNFISNASICSKALYERLGGRKLNCVDDWCFWLTAMRKCANFAHFPYPVYYQRFYKDSLFGRQVAAWGMGQINKQLKEAAYGRDSGS